MLLPFLHIAGMYLLDYVLRSSTTEAEAINRLHIYFYVAAGFILLVVTAAMVYVLLAFRHKKENENFAPKSLSSKWEIPMIGVPLLMVGIFFFMMLGTMRTVLPSAEGKQPEVIVTGHQWWWEAQYPQQKVTTANEIHLPAGRKILLKMLSADVIHDWWIPEFGNKMDLVPGRENHLWLTIKKPGRYEGACSEFCGAQHAGMRLIVVAQPEEEYNEWLMHLQTAATAADSLQQKGVQIFADKTCGNCHSIQGTNARGRAGPDLTHLASRQTLLTGLMANNKENLSSWLQHPQKIKPGANMPDFFLDQPSLQALVAYLSSLK